MKTKLSHRRRCIRIKTIGADMKSTGEKVGIA